MSAIETINTILATIIAIMLYIALMIGIRYAFMRLYHKAIIDYHETKYLFKQAIKSHKSKATQKGKDDK